MVPLLDDKNRPTHLLDEALDALVFLSGGALERVETPYTFTIRRKNLPPDRVAVIVSGGGGLGPLFPAFAGEGLADASCSGDFDCAPSAYALYETARRIHRGRGALFLTNNYMGDFLNNDMAQELLRIEGIDSRVCYVNENLFSAFGESPENRGGLCGIGLLTKIAAAAAGAGASLEEAYRIVRKAADRTRSVTVKINLETKNLEFGEGFSGEEPRLIIPYTDMDGLCRKTRDLIMEELGAFRPGKICFQVNRIQQLSYVESLAVVLSLKRVFEEAGYEVISGAAGDYFNAYSGFGCIITVMAPDRELEGYLHSAGGYGFTI